MNDSLRRMRSALCLWCTLGATACTSPLEEVHGSYEVPQAGSLTGLSGNTGSAGGSAGGGADTSHAHVSATWFAALDDANAEILGFQLPPVAPLYDVSVREIAHLSLGGDALRIRFSNDYGGADLSLSKVRVAKSTGEAAIDPSTDTAVTFRGARSVTLAPNTSVWSDDIALPVDAHGDVAVTIYVQGSADIATEHRFAQRTNYVAFGDWTSEPEITGFFLTTGASYWMSEIVALRDQPANVVVAFGDSITDGFNSTPDANLRYPDQLSRLQSLSSSPGAARSVVNAGIGGNRWLHGGLGSAAVERFSRDALEVTGATDLVIMMGINDIGFGALAESEAVTLDQLKAAIGGAAMQARAAGLRVFLGTLPPFGESFYFTDAGEKTRKALNDWILANANADGAVDFDRLLRDPANPRKLDASYDSGDQLHPNDAGYAAMADAVNAVLR